MTSIAGTKKRPGRPATGQGVQIQVRIQPEQLRILDAWVSVQPDPKPTRPAAIRKLMAKALVEARVDVERDQVIKLMANGRAPSDSGVP